MCALVGCVVGWLVWCVCHAWWFRPLSGPKMFRQSVRTAGREVVVGCCHRIRTCGSADEPCAGVMFAWLAAARLWTQPLYSDGLMDEAESGRREHPCVDRRSMLRRLLAGHPEGPRATRRAHHPQRLRRRDRDLFDPRQRSTPFTARWKPHVRVIDRVLRLHTPWSVYGHDIR